jgi:hypothetical protein
MAQQDAGDSEQPMSLSTMYWIFAAPYILMVAGALLVASFCSGLILLDQFFIQPVAAIIDQLYDGRRLRRDTVMPITKTGD